MRLFFCLIPLVLAACADSTTYLKNMRTGEVVKCGSDAQCIKDYKDQGFVRVPGPD